MPLIALLAGLGCGILLAAVTLGLLGAVLEAHAVVDGAHAVARGAAGVLVIAALLGWGSGLPALESVTGLLEQEALGGPVLSLLLMAALAVPLRVDRSGRADWSSSLLYVPGWMLASAALILMVTPGRALTGSDWVTPVRFSLAVCGGIGGRALGQALQAALSGRAAVVWPGTLTYGLLTFICGAAGLVNLWQRGGLWVAADPVLRGGIAGAWLAWTADWLVPRTYAKVGAVVTALAAALLVLAAVKPV
jgi:hypothetical protein